MPEHRFPPPWSVEELEACFIVTDSAGQKLAYIYFEEEPGRRAAAKLVGLISSCSGYR
jgi:hypothetical protein